MAAALAAMQAPCCAAPRGLEAASAALRDRDVAGEEALPRGPGLSGAAVSTCVELVGSVVQP